MNKKYCALLSVFLLVGCSEKNSQSTTSTSTPQEIVFEEYSFAQMDKNYEEAGVCPDKILSTYVPSYTNTTFTLNYHGMNRGRGENEVIIYNVGSQSNCNAWGYEVAVNKEGYVVEVKSLVTIPEDGFAISGHGTDNIDFITANFKVGQKVSYENGVITVIDNLYESRMFELNASTIAFQSSYKEKFDRLENIDYSVKDDVDTLCNCSLKAQNALNTYYENKSTDALKAFMSYSSYFKKIAEDGTKKLFHTEYKYASNKYTDNKYLISLRRHFEYYLSIENIRQNENLDKEFIRITISDIYLVRLIFRQVSSWFFSIEYKNLYKANGKRLEIVKKITNATVPLRDKYLELEPIVISYENEDIKGVRLYLSSRNNFTDISAEKFTGLVYIIESINMYEASLLQINYLQFWNQFNGV